MLYLEEMMKWHFSEKTGSPYWLMCRDKLGFDPCSEIKSLADLRRLPDPSDDLRNLSFEYFLPRGLAGFSLAGIYESGGTSGKAKRLPVYAEWLDDLIKWRVGEALQPDETGNTLAVIPTGPHIVGEINRRRARARGGVMFAVDFDPRWVKKSVAREKQSVVDDYVNHLFDQAAEIIQTQDIKHLVATPPFLERLSGHPLRFKLQDTLVSVTWGGTQMDSDTLTYLRTELFPNARVEGSYGNTMMLGEAKQIGWNEEEPIFAPFSPHVLLDVLDKKGNPVAPGEQGRVISSHVSKYALIPNVLERDLATKIMEPRLSKDTCVSAVKPLPSLDGTKIIEGVY